MDVLLKKMEIGVIIVLCGIIDLIFFIQAFGQHGQIGEIISTLIEYDKKRSY